MILRNFTANSTAPDKTCEEVLVLGLVFSVFAVSILLQITFVTPIPRGVVCLLDIYVTCACCLLLYYSEACHVAPR